MSILNYFKKVPSEVVDTINDVDLPNITAESLKSLEKRGKKRGKVQN